MPRVTNLLKKGDLMKIFVLFSFLLGLNQHAFSSAPSKEKRGLLLKIDFRLKDAKKAFHMKNELILNKENNDWTPLTPSQDGVALLGKIHKPEKGTFLVQYMIVDTSTKPVIVHQMGIISQLDKSSRVSSQVEGEEISVTLLTRETSYQE